MKLSKYLVPTLKDDPADATVMSHRLMVRAGLMRKESAGMYAYLPLGFRVIRKVTEIVRQEMDRSGAQEFLMPEMTSAEFWKESGRWDVMGPEMFRITDRNGQEYAMAPTHEEAFTAVVRNIISSYRDLPVNVYQINTKFRDEIRPRYGVIRSKEFIMKDAYSFDMDEAGLEKSYQQMRQVYRRIFERCGLETIPVEADTGNMGGSNSEEFMVASEVGEETLLICESCGYRANQEKASFCRPEPMDEALLEMKTVETPNVKTIEQLEAFLNLPGERFLKSIIYLSDGKPVMAVVPGDREINEIKLKNALGAMEVVLAPDSVVTEVTGAPVGFAGPVTDKKITMVFDLAVAGMKNAVTGANKKDFHFTGVNPGRDFKTDRFADLCSAREGDACPHCGAMMHETRGIEVGHIFKLGYKYTKAMNVTVLDEAGKEVTPIMGCYGIGVNRTVAAVVEQNHDERGIIWPASIAPFDVHLVGLGKTDEEKASIDMLYEELRQNGFDVLYDDRKASPGFKFADADLMGIPIRVTAGKSFFADGSLEIKLRHEKDFSVVPSGQFLSRLKEMVAGDKK